MNTQDKEFDDLFRSRLDSLEANPSADLWDNIAAEVIMQRPNRSALPYISIAATILLLIRAGLFFIPEVKQKNNNTVQHSVAEVKGKGSTPRLAHTTVAEHRLSAQASAQLSRQKPKFAPKNNSLPAVKAEANKINDNALVNERKPVLLAAIDPGAEIKTSVDPVVTSGIDVKVKTVTVATLAPPVKPVALARGRKRGINSFGDLINVVVKTVDKRKDKLIEFTNTDEDDSMVTGVNLGIVKIKKEEVIAKNK